MTDVNVRPKSVGSWDDVEDVVDRLDRMGVAFVLVIGRLGEDHTRTWSQHLGNTDECSRQHVVEVVRSHVERCWK